MAHLFEAMEGNFNLCKFVKIPSVSILFVAHGGKTVS
jgi:hypothetical protein